MGKKKELVILCLILLLGLGLRLIALGQSFWLDEASQAQLSSLSLAQIWFGRGGDFHPPLFYILAHFWLQIGTSEVWLRLLPLIFGLLNIYVLYNFAQKLFPATPVKLLAAFLFAISPYHIFYSHEFRMYSLITLLGTLSMYYFHSRKYSLSSLTNVLLLYTHYSSVFLIIAQVAYTIFYRKEDIKSSFLSHLFTVILYVPWLPQFFRQLSVGVNVDQYFPGWKEMLSVSPIKALPLIFFKLTAGRISFLSRYLYGLYIIFVFAAMTFSFITARLKTTFLYIWIIVPVFAMMALSFFLPQNQPFRVIYILPALVLIFAQACLRYPKLGLTLFIYIALVGNITYYSRPRLQREQWRQALDFISQSGGTAVIKFSDKFAPISWYTPHLRVIPAVPTYPAKWDEVDHVLSTNSPLPTDLYVFEYLGEKTDPQLFIERALESRGYSEQTTFDYPGVGFIRHYTQP